MSSKLLVYGYFKKFIQTIPSTHRSDTHISQYDVVREPQLELAKHHFIIQNNWSEFIALHYLYVSSHYKLPLFYVRCKSQRDALSQPVSVA